MLGPLTWLCENPGTQLLTGSFHPVTDEMWDVDAYGNTSGDSQIVFSACFAADVTEMQRLSQKPLSIEPDQNLKLSPLATCMLGIGGVKALECIKILAGRFCATTPVGLPPLDQLTHLHVAAYSGDVKFVELLLSRGFSASAVGLNGKYKFSNFHEI